MLTNNERQDVEAIDETLKAILEVTSTIGLRLCENRLPYTLKPTAKLAAAGNHLQAAREYIAEFLAEMPR